jgi:hypothetical protein
MMIIGDWRLEIVADLEGAGVWVVRWLGGWVVECGSVHGVQGRWEEKRGVKKTAPILGNDARALMAEISQ